jgi:hypothetical protein
MIAFTDGAHRPMVDITARLYVAVVVTVIGHHPAYRVAVPSTSSQK